MVRSSGFLIDPGCKLVRMLDAGRTVTSADDVDGMKTLRQCFGVYSSNTDYDGPGHGVAAE